MNQDELIQKQIEEGNNPQGLDADAYRFVFSALKNEPTVKLSADFASKVASKAPAPSKSIDWDMFFLFAGFGVFGIVLLYAAVVTNFTPSFGAFQFLKGYPLMVVLAAMFILAAEWLDRKLLKRVNF